MVVSDKKGAFEWHVNPSTSPLVAKSEGEENPGDPSPPQQFSGGPSNDASPCPAYFELPDTRDPTCWNDHAFEVPADGGGINNEYTHVEVTWATPASDWDLEIYRDSNGDGSSENEGEPVAEDTDLLIESFPRPASSFALAAFNLLSIEMAALTGAVAMVLSPATTASATTASSRPSTPRRVGRDGDIAAPPGVPSGRGSDTGRGTRAVPVADRRPRMG
jgi:hypothetical protein